MLPKRAFEMMLCLLSAVFFLIGVVFLASPGPAAAFYGVPSHDREALLYVRAVGLRDLALASYLLGLTLKGQHRALSIVLAGTILIPVGDILLLASAGGQAAHYLLHGASALCFAALALWSHRTGRAT
jgi:hypothetical protein